MPEQFGNQASSQVLLVTAVSAGDLTCIVDSLGDSPFTMPSDGDFSLLWDDEISKVTAVTQVSPGYQLTLERGAESTTAAAHEAGTRVYHWLTKRTMETLMQAYSVAFSATGSPPTLSVLGTAHGFDFSAEPPVIQLWDNGSPTRDMIASSVIRYNPTTGDITITFTEDQTGTVIVLGKP